MSIVCHAIHFGASNRALQAGEYQSRRDLAQRSRGQGLQGRSRGAGGTSRRL